MIFVPPQVTWNNSFYSPKAIITDFQLYIELNRHMISDNCLIFNLIENRKLIKVDG